MKTLHIFLKNFQFQGIQGIFGQIVLLTQHHNADEVSDDPETAGNDSEGPANDGNDIVIIRSLVIFATGGVNEF